MIIEPVESADAVPQSLPAPAEHPEFFPLESFGNLLQGPARAEPVLKVPLETTGVTQHDKQSELFNTRLLHKSSVIIKLRLAGADELADRLAGCHTEQSWAQCRGCARVRTFWNRCENFFCPCCQPTLARDRAESIQWWTREISQPKHLVLTVRNSATLTFAYVRWFKQCLTKLRRRKLFRHVRGGTWALEVTNESKGWHLHAHLLLDAHYIEESTIAKEWAEIVGQDMAIVAIRDARRTNYLKEVTKYAVKGSQLASWSPADIVTFITAFKGQRTFGVFGSLYGKRTLYAEWIKTLTGSRKKCECGCEQWRFFSEQEWEAHLLTAEIKSGASMPPPNAGRSNPQRAFAFGLSHATLAAIHA